MPEGYNTVITSPLMAEESQGDTQIKPVEPEGSRYDGLGRLLTLAQKDPDKVAREVLSEWQRQDPAMRNRKVFWDVNTLRLRGIRGVRATPLAATNRSWPDSWNLYVPPGAVEMGRPVMDRTDELCERVTAHLLADPPIPEPEPSTDSDEDRDAAEFSKKVLVSEAGTAGVNYQAKFRRAHKKAAVYGSSFLYVWTDPTGGGQQPKRIQALPGAQTLQDATVDPMTGQEAPPEMLQERFLGPEGEDGAPPPIVDDEQAAAKQWKPKLRMDVLTGLNVRFMPEQCSGIEDADGALVLYVRTLGQLKDQFESLRNATPETLVKLVAWRPEAMRWVLPWFARLGYQIDPVMNADGTPNDASLVGCIARYEKVGPAYPKGCYIIVAGGAVTAHAGTWMVEVEQPDGAVREEPRDIPLAQIRQFDDTDGDDPYGYGLVTKVGPADEVNGTIVLAWLDFIDRTSRPNTWVPMGSPVEPEDLSNRLGLPLFYNAGQGVPIFEDIRPFDPSATEFYDRSNAYQDDVSALQQSAQGTESPNSQSGRAKAIVIQQVAQNLATQRQNLADGIERAWRLMLQEVRANWTIPQRMTFTTEDGSYAEQEWSRADLGSTKDVKIAIGSFTQYAPQQKAQLAAQYVQMGIIDDPDDLKRITASAVHPHLGLTDDPAVQRVRGQLNVWKQGPPEGWEEAHMAFQQAQQGAMQAVEERGAPPEMVPQMMQMAQVQPPPSPFDRVPSDEEPKIALKRHRELSRFTQTKALQRFGPAWAEPVMAECEAMRMAAVPIAPWLVTAKEQQMMAQQQAEQQAAEKEAERGAASEEKERDREDGRAARQDKSELELTKQAGDIAANAATQPEPMMMG